jgi:hypothetical protein
MMLSASPQVQTAAYASQSVSSATSRHCTTLPTYFSLLHSLPTKPHDTVLRYRLTSLSSTASRPSLTTLYYVTDLLPSPPQPPDPGTLQFGGILSWWIIRPGNEADHWAHLVSKLRTHGAIPPLSYAFMARRLHANRKKFTFPVTNIMRADMGVKLGLSHWGTNIGWGCSRIGCWGGYLGLRGTG